MEYKQLKDRWKDDKASDFIVEKPKIKLEPVGKKPEKSDIEEIKEVKKFNPYHDRLGRFASGNGSAGIVTFSANPNTKAGQLAIERENQRAAAQRDSVNQRMAARMNAGNKNIDTFTENMTPMQKGKVLKALNKRYNYGEQMGSRSEKEFCEAAKKQGLTAQEREYVKSSVLNARFEGKSAQWDLICREEKINRNQFLLEGKFRRGEYQSPLADYFKTGDISKLPPKYKNIEYHMSTGKDNNLFWTMTKTAYQYFQHIGGNIKSD